MEEPALPPIPEHVTSEITEPVEPQLPPLPSEPVLHALPPLPPHPPHALAPKPSVEFQLGRWLTRIGALFFVLSLVFFATWIDVKYQIHERLGPAGKIGVMGLMSTLVIALGKRLERKKPNILFFGRTLMAAGLAGLYFTIYAAYFIEPLQIISSPLFDGFLLLLWSVYVLLLAERRKSQILALFAITLAYTSTAINPISWFTMVADLLLAFTAVVFLLRNGWAALSDLQHGGHLPRAAPAIDRR